MAVRKVTRVVVAVMLLLAIGSAAQAAAAPTSTRRVVGLERQLLNAINETRSARGLRPLGVSPGLRAAALGHSRAMLAGGFFAHESPDGLGFPDRLKRAYPPKPNGAWTVGENLYASSVEPAAAAAVAAWLASPPHRGILLSRQFEDVGIGVVRAPVAGGDFGNQPAWAITADFGARGRTTAGKRN